MKVLVQQMTTRRFLSSSDSWTDNPSRARSFHNRSEAVQFCREKRLPCVQAVLKFETAGLRDVILPIQSL